ncbi:MAG TPA: hypothetical protein PK765_01100 [bacterium]|nr:hypothetical protein [bacterium]
MFAEVIPLHSSASDRGFTYRVPENLRSRVRTGSLVSVPWRDRHDEGIVSVCQNTIPDDGGLLEIREISELLNETPVLSAAEIDTAHAISARRYIPIHRSIGLFLPSPIIARARKTGWDLPEPRSRQPSDIVGQLSFCRDSNAFERTIAAAIAPSTMLLFPDDQSLRYWLGRIGSVEHEIMIVPDKFYRTRRATIFREFRAAEHRIVATVRKGIFLPLDAFDRIVSVEEGLLDRYEAFRHEYSFDEWTSMLAYRSGITLDRIALSPPLQRLYQAIRTNSLVTR